MLPHYLPPSRDAPHVYPSLRPLAFVFPQMFRGLMPRRSSSDTPSSGFDARSLKPGVWNDPAAPDGYVGIVVVSNSGERWIRFEIAAAKYSPEWAELFQYWFEHGDLGSIHIVP